MPRLQDHGNPFAGPFFEQLSLGFVLTAKQRLILGRVLSRQTHKQIAAALSIDENTVNTHLKRLYAKFGVHGQLELVLEITARYARWLRAQNPQAWEKRS